MIMKRVLSLLAVSTVIAGSTYADYEMGPPEHFLASQKLVVVDATVQEVVEEGPVKIVTKEIVVGKKAPAVLNYIALTCLPGLPASAAGMKKGKRYIIVTEGEQLFECSTVWEVLKGADGELVCHYKGQQSSPASAKVKMPAAGMVNLAEFKKQIKAVASAARKKAG